MGAERDDATAPKPRRSGTDPGLGGIPAGSGHGAAAAPTAPDDDQPEAVDFDALHAALGDPLALDDLPAEGPDYDAHSHDVETSDLGGGYPNEDEDVPPGEDEGDGGEDYGDEDEPHVGESQGRSSAQYASSRPHTIPPSHVSTEDMNAPPVIVATEDIGQTVPSGPPQQMTRPINQTRPIALTPMSGVPFVTQPPSAHSSGPYPAAAVAAPLYHEQLPHTEPPAYARGGAQMTVRMPDRPVAPLPNPRRGKVETLVVRPRGPSTRQKLLAFMAMLLLVTACGIAVIIWRKPAWVGLEVPGAAASTSLAPPTAPVASPAESTAASTTGAPSAVPSSATSATSAPSASASAAPKPKPKPSPAPPASPH